MINFAAITPHPPIIIPGIGKPEELLRAQKTISALKKLGRELEKAKPDVVVIISPHAPIHPYSFGVNKKHYLYGKLTGSKMIRKFKFRNDTKMADRIVYACEMNNEIPIHFFRGDLNYGMLVPLFYLIQKASPMILPISFSSLGLPVHHDFGELLGKICREEKNKVAIIASGNLSHHLDPKVPEFFSSRGAEFDQKLIKSLERGAVAEILELKDESVERAQECALRSIVMLLGALKGTKHAFRKYSYEAPFGTGLLAARLL